MIFKNLGLKEFQEYTKDKSIFCFGSGTYFMEFFSKFNNVDNVKLIIDNNKNKIGSFLSLYEKKIKIVSLEYAINQIDDNTIFLITAYYNFGLEIYNQLEKIESLKHLPVYWAFYVLNCNDTKFADYKYNKINFRKSKSMQIPKIIHYAWFGENPIPEEYADYIKNWRRLCPDYKFIKWDENNYDINKNNFMRQAYEAKAWAFVSDYVRKDVIYQYGGVYLDTDVEMIKNIDDLLYQDGFCAFERNQINSGLGFGAKKGHRIIKEWQDVYENINFNKNDILKNIPCPIYETDILSKYKLKIDGSLQNIMGMTVYPSEVLSGINLITGESIITPNTYMVHHYAASWTNKEKRNERYKMRKLFKQVLTNKID